LYEKIKSVTADKYFNSYKQKWNRSGQITGRPIGHRYIDRSIEIIILIFVCKDIQNSYSVSRVSLREYIYAASFLSSVHHLSLSRDKGGSRTKFRPVIKNPHRFHLWIQILMNFWRQSYIKFEQNIFARLQACSYLFLWYISRFLYTRSFYLRFVKNVSYNSIRLVDQREIRHDK